MTALALACANLDQFKPWFIGFLLDNEHVWDAFEAEAWAVLAVGFQHYSARTIVYVLRHQSALRQVGGVWKLNNDISPYLARLWALMYPAHAGLFEYRSTDTRRALP